MIVVTERTDCKGDIKQYDHIKAINDKGRYYELYISENWQIRVPKKNHKILAVTG